MSRARDMANLGAQAGSGFDASDITTGTLGNTVQDNITRLGNVTTGTIGSGVSFPTGKLINSVFYHVNTGSVHSTTSTTNQAAINYMEFDCTTGNTIYFGFNFYAYVRRQTGTIDARYGRFNLYQRAKTGPSDTRPAESDTGSSLGTKLWTSVYGRILVAADDASAASYAPFFGSASFLATADTHFLGLVFNAEAAGTYVELVRDSNHPVTAFAMEFEGDVHTTGAIP